MALCRIMMPTATAPLRNLLLEDERGCSSEAARVDQWGASVVASLMRIPKRWSKASVARRRWYFAVRCISWMRMLSQSAENFSPFSAPQLLMLRNHAIYIDTCCRLFYTSHVVNVRKIEESLQVLEDGPLAHLSFELLELWRRQAAMDLTLPAVDLALLHQHRSLPSHDNCKVPDSQDSASISPHALGLLRNPEITTSALAYVKQVRLPAFFQWVPNTLRLSAKATDHQIHEATGVQYSNTQGRLQMHQPSDGRRFPATQGIQAPSGQRYEACQVPSSYQDLLSVAPSGYSSSHGSSSDAERATPHIGHCRPTRSDSWEGESSPQLWGISTTAGNQGMKCSISFRVLGIHLEHRPPEDSQTGRRERWLFVRSNKVNDKPCSSPERQAAETTEWFYCPERVSFRKTLHKGKARGTLSRLEQRSNCRPKREQQQHLGSPGYWMSRRFTQRPGVLQGATNGRPMYHADPKATPRKSKDGIDLLVFGVTFQSVTAFGSTDAAAGFSSLADPSKFPTMGHFPEMLAATSTSFDRGSTCLDTGNKRLEGTSLDRSVFSMIRLRLRITNMYCGPTEQQWSEPGTALTGHVLPH